ncbi:unnamed protein product [Brassica oleracea var. botrytis]
MLNPQQESQLVIPNTHERSVCSSLYESHKPAITHLLRSTMIAESVLFSSDKRYATTQVKAPPQLQKTVLHGAVRVLTVSHGFVYKPYALHGKISWWRSELQVCCFCKCLYVTYGSLRSLYSTHELAGVSAAILNFLQSIYNPTCPLIFFFFAEYLYTICIPLVYVSTKG